MINFTGTVFNQIETVLGKYNFYQSFRRGIVSRADYYQKLMVHESELRGITLTEDQIHLSSRFPLNEEEIVDIILEDLRDKCLIEATNYPKAEFLEYRKLVYSRYDHDKYHTFIFPEEERIAYALAYILHPTSAILLGSYYGYWGIWIMPAICERGGMAYFVDSNESVSVVAANNLNKLGYDKNSEVIICEGTNFLSNIKQQYDFVALDAEGDSTHPNPDFRGKAVYYPLIKACFEHITNGSVVLCHNILLRNPIQDPYFMRKIDKNLSEFSKFLPFMKNNFRQGLDYSTTEGIGIYRK